MEGKGGPQKRPNKNGAKITDETLSDEDTQETSNL